MDGADGKPRSDRPREKKKKKKSRPKPSSEEVLHPPVAEADGKPDGERKERKKKKKSSRSRSEQANGQGAEAPAPAPAKPQSENAELPPEMEAQRKKLEAAKERELQRRKEEKERKRRERKERERRQREEEERKRREEEERQRAAALEKQKKEAGDDDDDDEYGDEDFDDYSEEEFEAEEEEKVLEASSPPPVAKKSPVISSSLRKKTEPDSVMQRASTQDLREIQESIAKQNAAAKERSRSRPPMPKAEKGKFTMIQSTSPQRARPGSSHSSSTSERPRTARAARMYKETNVQASMAKFAKRGGAQRAKRVQDLLSLVKLEEEKYVTLNQMPVSSYEMYVRKLRGTLGVIRQIASQSNEDDRTIEVQTDEIETKDQEAQFSMGDDTDFENILQALREKKSIENFKKTGNSSHTAAASLRLTSFIQGAAQVCEAVCEKNVEQYNKHFTDDSESKDDSSCFLGGSKWSMLGQSRRLSQTENNDDFLAKTLFGREITGLHFSRLQPNMVCSSYMSRSGFHDPLEACGLLCIWNTLSASKPSRFGVSRAGLTCCSLGHFQTHIVLAGTADGQILLWDLRESKREIQAQQDEFQKIANSLCTEGVVRSPTYTSSSLGPAVMSHTSKIVSIAPIPVEILSRSNDGASRSSFQAASLDDRGLLALWLVTEIEKVEPGGSSKDLGLSISGRIRLVLSRTLWVDPSKAEVPRRMSLKNTTSFKSKRSAKKKEDAADPGPTAQAVAFYPKDPNRFLVALSDGSIIQGARFGTCPPPKNFQIPISFGTLDNAPVPVNCLHFSPFISEYFLAGCKDGTLRLYSILESLPVMHWVSDCFAFEDSLSSLLVPSEITNVKWSAHRPAVFYVINGKAEVYIFDLLKQQNSPVFSEKYDGHSSGVELHAMRCQHLISLSEEKTKIGRPRLVLNFGASIIWRTLSHHLVTPRRDIEWEMQELGYILSSALL